MAVNFATRSASSRRMVAAVALPSRSCAVTGGTPSPGLATEAGHGRVEQGLFGHHRFHALVEVADVHGRAWGGELGREPGVGDALADGVAVGGAGDVADRAVAV